jgi:hypothetical protein
MIARGVAFEAKFLARWIVEELLPLSKKEYTVNE